MYKPQRADREKGGELSLPLPESFTQEQRQQKRSSDRKLRVCVGASIELISKPIRTEKDCHCIRLPSEICRVSCLLNFGNFSLIPWKNSFCISTCLVHITIILKLMSSTKNTFIIGNMSGAYTETL